VNGLRDVGSTMVKPHVRRAPFRDMGSEWARMGPNGPEWALPNRLNGPTAMHIAGVARRHKVSPNV